jgi:hypothetical protein
VASTAGEPLKPKQELYVEYLLQGYCQTDAARLAGFEQSDNALYVTASRLLRNAKVQERIAARIAEAQVETDEVIGTLVSIQRGTIEDMLVFPDYGKPFPDLKTAKDNGVLHLVKELSYSPDGTVKIKLHDSAMAAVQLSRIMNLDKSQQRTGTLTISQIRAALAKKNMK